LIGLGIDGLGQPPQHAAHAIQGLGGVMPRDAHGASQARRGVVEWPSPFLER